MTREPNDPAVVSRRALLLGGGGLVAGAAGAAAGIFAATGGSGTISPLPSDNPAPAAPIPAAGLNQAGVARPEVPQQYCLVAVADLDLATLEASLAALGDGILSLTAGDVAEVTPDGPRDLTVTVGLGPAALAASAHPALAEAVTLPAFAGDATLPPERLGGQLLLSVNASDPSILEPALAFLTAAVDGFRLRWSDLGVRGPAEDGVTRNPFGYLDGIIVPRGEAELARTVWIADGPLAEGTICVIRRFRTDVAAFRALDPDRRDAVMGREQVSGAPLSGGGRDDDVDLVAKTDDGTFLVPSGSHARAAHPSFTGSDLMLRRSYSYRASADDAGLLFISYQREVATFSRTQLRLDEIDDLMAFAAPTATAAFAILPGVVVDDSRRARLGATLF